MWSIVYTAGSHASNRTDNSLVPLNLDEGMQGQRAHKLEAPLRVLVESICPAQVTELVRFGRLVRTHERWDLSRRTPTCHTRTHTNTQTEKPNKSKSIGEPTSLAWQLLNIYCLFKPHTGLNGQTSEDTHNLSRKRHQMGRQTGLLTFTCSARARGIDE